MILGMASLRRLQLKRHHGQAVSHTTRRRPICTVCLKQSHAADDAGVSRRGLLRKGLLGTTVGFLHSQAGRLIVSGDIAEARGLLDSSSDVYRMAQDVEKRLRQSTVKFQLENGLTVLVRQRRNAPVFSALTYADVGAYDEEGILGVAHMLEHLAFKGSPRQSVNFEKESALLEHMDDVFEEARVCTDPRKKGMLLDRLDTMQREASSLAESNAYGSFLARQGAVGLNAETSHDATKYYVSLPNNKLELFFALEAERFQAPVFRDVYSEKKVVLEERKMRVEGSPMGTYQEEYAKVSFGNNYSRPVIGTEEDIENIGRKDVEKFFREKYGPDALTITIVGSVDPEAVRLYAEKYFGNWVSSVGHTGLCTNEPLAIPSFSSDGDRCLRGSNSAGPILLRSWYRPGVCDTAASIPLDIADECLTGGRHSRLGNALVMTSKALTVSSYGTFPGEKHPCQMLVYAVPTAVSDLQEVDQIILSEIDAFCDAGPTQQELLKFIKGTQSAVFGVLQSNAGMASALASYENLTTSWENIYKEMYTLVDQTPRSVADECSKYLTASNSFAGYVYKSM